MAHEEHPPGYGTLTFDPPFGLPSLRLGGLEPDPEPHE